jgi:hypothetical protein
MSNKIININNVRTVKHLKGEDGKIQKGKFRFIVKVRGGFTSCIDGRDFDNERLTKYPESIISGYKEKALQTVEFCPEGYSTFITLFARTGKKIHFIDETILEALTVGTINAMYINTELYDQRQYQAVNASSWASKAFTMNELIKVSA